jgi:outer membrane protein TolC
VETPAQWRVSLKEAGAYASLEWWKFLQDPQLNKLIETALRENQDLKMAVARIEEHRAILGVKKSALFPAIDLSGNATHYYLKENALTTAGVAAPSDESNSFSYNASQMAGSLSYC